MSKPTTATTHWWIVLYETADGTRSERQLPAADKADARRYFLASLTGDDAWRGVRVLSITRFANSIHTDHSDALGAVTIPED